MKTRRRDLKGSHQNRVVCIGGVPEDDRPRELGHCGLEELQPLCAVLDVQDGNPRDVAARSPERCDSPAPTGSPM